MARLGWKSISIALCCLGLGCGGAVGSKESGPAPDVLSLDAAGTTLSSPFAARLEATFGSVTLRDFGFSASKGAASVFFNARLAAADLSAGAATLTVSSGPIGDGIANAQVVGVTGGSDLDGAIATVRFSPSAVTGTLALPGGGAPWTLSSDLTVECLVPKARLSVSQQPAGGGTEGTGALFSDETFAAPECASLRVLAGLQ